MDTFVGIVIKNGFEENFMNLMKILINLSIKKILIYCENDSFENELKKFENSQIEIYENKKYSRCDFLYEIVSKYDGRHIFIMDLENFEIIKFMKNLNSYKLIMINQNDKYSNFHKELNNMNIHLIDKLFCYQYPKILLEKEFYKIDMFMVDTNALWIKKLFFELKLLFKKYIKNENELNFTLNFLNYKYLYHYFQ